MSAYIQHAVSSGGEEFQGGGGDAGGQKPECVVEYGNVKISHTCLDDMIIPTFKALSVTYFAS